MTTLAVIAALALGADAAPRTVTLAEALDTTRRSNLTWKALEETLHQASAGKSIAWGVMLPKVRVEGQWMHMGERNEPNMEGFDELGSMLGTIIGAIVREHPERAADFASYLDTSGSSGSSSFADFVPPEDTFSATFSLVVPIFSPTAIAGLRGAFDLEDAALQRVGRAREQLLYAVANAYYGLLTVQSLIAASERSIEAARQHFHTSQVKLAVQSATQLEVKRAELEVARAEAQKVELVAGLEKAKAGFRYLTGIEGPFEVVDPGLPLALGDTGLSGWSSAATAERKDLAAARIEVAVAEHQLEQVWAKYLPSVDFIAQGTADNAQAQRFDDDPYSWNLLATATWDLFDGGMREGELSLVRSKVRQARYAAEDLERKIASEVASAYGGIADAASSRALAERQLDVARDTQRLAGASEQAGVVTSVEVIDANTMVFASEAQALKARLEEAMAALELMSAVGRPLPGSDAPDAAVQAAAW